MSGRGSTWFCSYSAITDTTAFGRATRHAISNVPVPPAHSITASAPRPSVRSRTASSMPLATAAGLGPAGLMVTSANPSRFATARRAASMSSAITCAAP